MILSGAEIITEYLKKEGIEIVTGIPGGSNLPIYDALSRSGIRHILARHEQGAGFISHGMARSTGKTAVCLASSGPGATNLLTAIADAKLDSVPVVAITGQVPLQLIGTDAFQEVDTYGITRPVTKHNYFVRCAAELADILPEAFSIAASGRPGPVVIDVPKNVQLERIEFSGWPDNRKNCERIPEISEKCIKRIADMIHKSEKPLLYIGGGIISSNSSEILREFARKNSIPVACTLMGLGAFPANDPLYMGMLGMHAAMYTNYILDEADLLLAFGVRFDDRATGKINEFCKNAAVIHIDIDHAEINKLKNTNLPVVGDINSVLHELINVINEDKRADWIERINLLNKEYSLNEPLNPEKSRADLMDPINLIRCISNISGDNTIITTDVGQHQMWIAQEYPFEYPRTLITSGGLGTMGFGLPAAIGAALANPDKRVICISGDGSIFMNIQELATLAELNLDVKIIVFNNNHLGLVRQQQELFYNKNIYAARFDSDADFVKIGTAFGINSFNINMNDSFAMLHNALTAKGPCLINAPIHYNANVFPIVPPGEANRNMIISGK